MDTCDIELADGQRPIPRLKTYIPGLDAICCGGLPEGRTTLVIGTAGSGKTVFATEFVLRGIAQEGEPGVIVTFEEPLSDLRRNVQAFGWDVDRLEKEQRLVLIDASLRAGDHPVLSGDFDLEALLQRILHAARRVRARRVSIDSTGALLSAFPDDRVIRRELHRLSDALKAEGLSVVITAEGTNDRTGAARFGVEEYVADCVFILRNALHEDRRRRTVELLKMRGGPHLKGEFPFTITGGGMRVIPVSQLALGRQRLQERVSSGIPEVDRMCESGFFRDSVTLVSGATGTGKTLMAAHFLGALCGDRSDERRGLLFAYEESAEQVHRNASAWGIDLAELEQQKRLKINASPPEALTLEDHFMSIIQSVESYRPERLVLDSISALERIASRKAFREFMLCLSAFCREHRVATFLTSTNQLFVNSGSITRTDISSVTDTILLLRYVECGSSIRRVIAVLKMRGSAHDHHIREFDIDDRGMHVGDPLRGASGILGGGRPPDEFEDDA